LLNKKAALFTVFLAVLIDLIGFGLVLPLIPFYASEFKATPITIGLIYSIYSFAQLICSPFWGNLSDKIGRRPIMLISTFGACIAYIVFGLAGSIATLFISRLFAGVMGGNISAAQAYVADVTTHEDRAKGMGLIGAAFGIGFLLGPAIASLLISPKFLSLFHINEAYKYMIPGFFAAGLSLLSFIFVYFKLPETVIKNQTQKTDPERISKSSIFSKSFWANILAERPSGPKFLFPILILCVFLLSFGQASLYSSFPLFCKTQLNISVEKVGLLFAFMGLIAIFVQGGLIRVLVKKFKEEKIFLVGSILMVIGFCLIPLSATKNHLLLMLIPLALGGSLTAPTLTSFISKEADPSKQGQAMGTSQGISALGRATGPAWGGFLYSISFIAPFVVTAGIIVLTVIAGIVILKVRGKTETGNQNSETREKTA